jgi:hypothetical protein
MLFAPDGVHRRPVGDKRPADWYVIWLGRPEKAGSVVLGRSKRLRRHEWHRFFPEDGSLCRDIFGWTRGAQWLLDVHNGKGD